ILKEDFQTTYELGVNRFASGHSKVLVGRTNWVITAMKRLKAKTRRDQVTPQEVMATTDVLIVAKSVHNIPVKAQLEGRDNWLVETVIIGTEDPNVLAAPMTWISSSCPYLPVANPSRVPCYVQAGEVLGHLIDPEEYTDNPESSE
ncbi:hypothetical protein L208DRAFT_1077918, partial [Tricholoma matsutake]